MPRRRRPSRSSPAVAFASGWAPARASTSTSSGAVGRLSGPGAEPSVELGETFSAAGGAGKPRVGQVALAYDPDREAAVRRAREQFRWFGLGWKVNADLPNPDSFEGATESVAPEQIAEGIACGPDVDEHVEKVKPFLDVGFDEVALVQIGAEAQAPFISWAQRELLPALRAL